jgi:hypothetical protein
MREMLLPQTTLLTPNAPEARRLAESDEDENEPSIDVCAQRLIEMGAQYVLITGTHESTPQVINTCMARGRLRRDQWERLPGSYHGSGCTLASAIAGCIAGGASVEDAVRDAQDYTWQTLKNGFRPAWASSFRTVSSGRAAARKTKPRREAVGDGMAGLSCAASTPLPPTPTAPACWPTSRRPGRRLPHRAIPRQDGAPCPSRSCPRPALRELTRRFGRPLLINDDLALAVLVEADGVHLGRTTAT